MSVKQKNNLVRDELYVSQKKYYGDAYAKNGDTPWENAFEVKWLEKTVKMIGPAKNRKALEIGTGYGKGVRALHQAGWKTVGVDYIFEPLKFAVDYRKNRKRGPLYVQADMFEAPFRMRSFDLLLDWGVFHHTRRRDTPQFIAAITRLLKPGGVFLLGCFSTKFRHSAEKLRYRNWTRHHGHYDRFSTKRELVKTFKGAFEIDSIEEDRKGFYMLALRVRQK